MKKIAVAVIDDSASVRSVLTEVLSSDPAIQVIFSAHNPVLAERYLAKQWPDVFILDIEMPEKDGITFLKEIMSSRPTPVVICSALTEKNASVTMEAMRAGAVEILQKPRLGIKNFLTESAMMIIDAVKSASQANVSVLRKSSEALMKSGRAASLTQGIHIAPKLNADVMLPPSSGRVSETTEKFVAIGASAGGTQAIEVVLGALPQNVPGIVIVQHMPEKFTLAFANRLNSISRITVKEAEDGDRIAPGLALVAPGNRHMLVHRNGSNYSVQIKDGPPVSRHRPAVDVLFRSVAKYAGKNALGIILTGMGDDGAAGMLEMKNAGSITIAQNEETCIVFGMPKEAIARGGVHRVLPLEHIPGEIVAYGKH